MNTEQSDLLTFDEEVYLELIPRNPGWRPYQLLRALYTYSVYKDEKNRLAKMYFKLHIKPKDENFRSDFRENGSDLFKQIKEKASFEFEDVLTNAIKSVGVEKSRWYYIMNAVWGKTIGHFIIFLITAVLFLVLSHFGLLDTIIGSLLGR